MSAYNKCLCRPPTIRIMSDALHILVFWLAMSCGAERTPLHEQELTQCI
jgi:hypothetical protein